MSATWGKAFLTLGTGAALLAGCGPQATEGKTFDGVYGVLCRAGRGAPTSGIRLELSPHGRSPGVDIVICRETCVRPTVVAIELAGTTLTFDTRDTLPPQDGVSVAPERHFIAGIAPGAVTLQGSGDGYVLAPTPLKLRAQCPAGSSAGEP